jgi:putative membrane protein
VIGWSWEPSVILGSLILGGGYLFLTGPRRSRFKGSTPVSRWRRAAFIAGVGTILAALATPIDLLSDRYLLTAHMVQHMLLTLAMPPLLLLGTPGWLLRPLLRSWLVRAVARRLTRPVVAFLSFNLLLVLSHLPPIYNYALEDHRAHIALHLGYMVGAVITWWPVLSPLSEFPRLVYPLQMLYIFLQTIPGALVGSMISLANDVLYPTYAQAPRISGLSPLADQQLAGLIMWLGVSTYFFIIITVIFFTWANQEERKQVLSTPPGHR